MQQLELGTVWLLKPGLHPEAPVWAIASVTMALGQFLALLKIAVSLLLLLLPRARCREISIAWSC